MIKIFLIFFVSPIYFLGILSSSFLASFHSTSFYTLKNKKQNAVTFIPSYTTIHLSCLTIHWCTCYMEVKWRWEEQQ